MKGINLNSSATIVGGLSNKTFETIILITEVSDHHQSVNMAMTIPAMEMILPQGSSGNIPAFLAKLWKMVNNHDIGKHLDAMIR